MKTRRLFQNAYGAFKKHFISSLKYAAFTETLTEGMAYYGTRGFFNKDDESTLYPRERETVKKVFTDLGIKGNVYIKFGQETSCAGVVASFDKNSKRAAFVHINPRGFRDFSEEQQYAIIAHEAGHYSQSHQFFHGTALGMSIHFLDELSKKIPKSAKWQTLAFFSMVGVFNLAIGNIAERQADIFAAKKMGSAQPLIETFEKYRHEEEILLKNYSISKCIENEDYHLIILLGYMKIRELLDPHPSLENRIRYLSKLNLPKHSVFFPQSEREKSVVEKINNENASEINNIKKP